MPIKRVTTRAIDDGQITTAKITDASITAAKLDGAQSGSAPIYGCRAWVNFDAFRDSTGATTTANTNRFIRASGNVASVLRTGTGLFTVTFTTAMPDGNYCAVLSGQNGASNTFGCLLESAPSAGSCAIGTRNTTNFVLVDLTTVCLAIFR